MKISSFLLLTALSAFAQENLLSRADLSNWTFSSSDGAEAAAKSWKVEDGVLSTTGIPTCFIRTAKDYENYTLTFEWRWSGEKGGNSGLLLHVGEVPEGKPWPVSIEAQLESGNAGDFWSIGSKIEAAGKNTGTRWQRIVDPVEKPLGEWNTMTVTCAGGKIAVSVNGKLVNEGKNASVTKGGIGFQSEGSPIEFRNIVLIEEG